MTVPPEIKKLRSLAWGDDHDRVWVGDAEQAVRDAEARVRDHYHTTGRALREIGDVLRNGTLTDSRKVSAIAAVMANGPLDDAPGGPCEDAAFAARREAFREAVEALREEGRSRGATPANDYAEGQCVGWGDAVDFLERRFLTLGACRAASAPLAALDGETRPEHLGITPDSSEWDTLVALAEQGDPGDA